MKKLWLWVTRDRHGYVFHTKPAVWQQRTPLRFDTIESGAIYYVCTRPSRAYTDLRLRVGESRRVVGKIHVPLEEE